MKREAASHVRRLEAGSCGHACGGTGSHRGRGAPCRRADSGRSNRAGAGLSRKRTMRRPRVLGGCLTLPSNK